MTNNRLSEGVGKKIVEALKKQSEIEINPAPAEETMENVSIEDNFLDNFDVDAAFEAEEPEIQDEPVSFMDEEPQLQPAAFEPQLDLNPQPQVQQPHIQPQVQPYASYQQPAVGIADSFVNDLDTFEIPSNIAALKKLITQLPSGVTRQTGAQIIRQTMEALGISMKSVLQEAQEVQDGLSSSIKECQGTIQEYKKQIINLEKQSQNHQRQYSALNELISLFIQTGNR